MPITLAQALTEANTLPATPATGTATHLQDHGNIATILQAVVPQVITNTNAIPTLAPLASPTFTGTVAIPALNFTTASTVGQVLTASNTSGGVAWAAVPVASVAGRTGAITLAVADVSGAAPLASPGFSGTPTAPTATAGTSSTQIASTAFVATSFAPLASPTLTGTITLNGTVAGSGVATAATASTVVLRDANGNLSTANALEGYATTATAAGTTTLTVSSAYQQFFTGTTTQTVVLPVTSTLVLGQSYCIANNSTGAVTVQSSGANTVVTIPGGSQSVITCILLTGTSATSWSATPPGAPLASPALTGTPTAPTAASGTNTTQLASTAFVQTNAQITGGTLAMQATKTGAYTALAGDFVPCSASGGAFTVTLPTAPSNGTRVTVMKVDTSTNAVNISRGGSDVINVAAQTALTIATYLGCVTLEYNSGTWYNQEASAPAHFTWLAQSGLRTASYGDMPEGIYIPQAMELQAVQFRIGTADASGTTSLQLYTNTTNASTGTALSGASLAGATWNVANSKTIVTGPWVIAAGTYIQCNVTAVGTTPGARLYVDFIGVWL